MRMYQRRRQLSAEETASNAKARAEREKATMTCQCCGRKYLANTGTIAHHGYQRPGGGWQTASCSGAKHLPFEVNRDKLGLLIQSLTEWKARAITWRAEVEAETRAVDLTFSDHTQKRDAYGRRPKKSVQVIRETFDSVRTENSSSFRTYGWSSFDEIKKRDLQVKDREIENVTAEITAQQTRYDGWKQTHKWDKSMSSWKGSHII